MSSTASKSSPSSEALQGSIPKQASATEFATLYLQTSTTVHGVCNADTTIDAMKQSGIVMRASENGIVVSRNGVSALLPWANIKAAVIKP